MDLQMQGVGGLKASQAIRHFMTEEASDLQQPYICCITVHNTMKDKVHAYSAGIDAFQSKPIFKDDVLKLLVKVGIMAK